MSLSNVQRIERSTATTALCNLEKRRHVQDSGQTDGRPSRPAAMATSDPSRASASGSSRLWEHTRSRNRPSRFEADIDEKRSLSEDTECVRAAGSVLEQYRRLILERQVRFRVLKAATSRRRRERRLADVTPTEASVKALRVSRLYCYRDVPARQVSIRCFPALRRGRGSACRRCCRRPGRVCVSPHLCVLNVLSQG